MKNAEFSVGDFVRFNHPNGSKGVVVGFTSWGATRAEWCYGLDKAGEPIKAISNILHADRELVPITEAEYRAIAEAPAWSKR